ncbi:hypothetical protein GCM10023403_56760 [Pseudonocardia benzenivorans]|uniref:Uncharacterized protein n=1 Tax=Pseudonocardia dioxanivorans (strain ATCC 55486 / DSM 44775 / JCM 13855 / CB1190) TaxID=675635 RepID=F4CS55_PSEUX|nr:hypothetical protein Psed_0342 [Pseudonocardia dioxanivorans CB1190]GJF07643.1 hypothetical protein PSD17_65880 [Pseudonocardia sp. D17]
MLVLGIDPYAIPGLPADDVQQALDAELRRFGDHGLEASMTLVPLDASALVTVAAALEARAWDVVVVGGGLRKPEALLELFEQVVNLIRREVPKAAIAFNTSGGDSVEAALRWLPAQTTT